MGGYPLVTGLLAFVLGVGASVLVGRLDAGQAISEERNRVLSELALTRASLEGTIKATFNSTDGLVHLISAQRGISKTLFAEMAELAIGKNPHIRNIALAPDDVVADVFPLAGNESLLGFSYESNPEQYRTVRQARALGHSLLVGPVKLVQGGLGLINRTPVFVRQSADGSLHYWGTLAVVARQDSLLGILASGPESSLHYALRDKARQENLIAGDPALFTAMPVIMDLQVPGGEWQLAAVPAGGWQAGQLTDSRYFQLGVLISFLVAIIVALRSSNVLQARERNQVLEQEIRERRRVEIALQEEERRFRTLFESSPDAAWIIEGEQFLDCNQAAATLLGYASPQEIPYDRPDDISPSCQPDGELSSIKARRMMAEARAKGVCRFEWEHQRCDGSTFPAEVTLLALMLQGRPMLYAVVRDITERVRAEFDLKASQNLLETIIDSAGAVIYMFDPDSRLLICNQLFENVLGHPRSDMLGHRRHDFMPVAIADEHEANDRQVLASGERMSFEEVAMQADGLHHFLTVKCPIIHDGVARGIVGISTDISERKQHEERLKLSAAVLSSTAEGVIITDEHARITMVNRAFTEITGYQEAEVLGKKPGMLRSNRHDKAFYSELWRTLIDTGVWQGEIWNRRKNGELFPEWLTISAIRDGADRLTHYVGVFSDISSIKHSQEKLERLAHFDPLTDLPNRILFQDRLTHAIDRATRYEQQVAVLLMDLDGFKTINDSLGHPAGDSLLNGVALRLRECIRVEDTVARLGGDEFALILANLNDGGDAIEVVRKILARIEQPFDLEGMGAMVTGSIGIAVYPADGVSPTELVRNADAAMYGAKEAGRNTYRFYQAAMTERAQDRLFREAALRRAIECKEFEVWFQPQISLQDGYMTGAEALVRWRDPQHGLIPPIEFIPLAERTGQIIQIGEQVLAEVCACARRWLDQGLPFGRLAINVALPQIERGDFVALLRRYLAASNLPPDCLEIEITESFIMESAGIARDVLLSIQGLGVTTAVDDFGTGYSSLAYLKNLPIDNVKIDRAFIRDLPENEDDVAIARAIIAMAHSLGFKVIAEGIEEQAQIDFLRAEQCDEIQGFFIGRPMPVAEFENWLRCSPYVAKPIAEA